MKIFEILNPKFINIDEPNDYDPDKIYQDLIKHNKLYYATNDVTKSLNTKRGAYSKGRPSISNPFMFHKTLVQPKNPKDDPYFNYVQAMMPYMDSNPYFPKIYVVKIRTDSNDRAKISYMMERLFDFNDLPTDQLGRRDILLQIGNRALYRPRKRHAFDNLGIIADAIINNNTKEIKDPLLKQAIRVISNISYNFNYDMHEGNFLYRLTPYGTQLVISDPLAI